MLTIEAKRVMRESLARHVVLMEQSTVGKSPITIDEMKSWLEMIDAHITMDGKFETMMGVGSGDGDLFVYGSHEAIKSAQALVLDGEKWRKMGGDWPASAVRELAPQTVNGHPTHRQVDAAYAAFLEINGGDTDKAKTDLGTWAIVTHAIRAQASQS